MEAKPLVSNLIAMDRRLEGNDLLCLLKFWRVHDQIDIPEDVFYTILKNGTHPEVIRRSRQLISEERRKAYGITSETEEKRLELGRETRAQAKQATLWG